jgi:hypothetical protein
VCVCVCHIAGGRGGALNSNLAFLAVLNSTFSGFAVDPTAQTLATPAAGTQRSRRAPLAETAAAAIGGCLAMTQGSLLLSGSRLEDCGATVVGGGLSLLWVDSVMHDSHVSRCFADVVRQCAMHLQLVTHVLLS